MKKHFWWVLTTLLILSFQNCGKPIPPKTNDGESVGPAPTDKKIISGDYSLKFWDYSNNRFFEVDLHTGRMYEVHAIEETQGATYCLSAEDQAKLAAILNGAEVCKPSVTVSPDAVCTMEYRYPYASIVGIDREEPLGEKKNGCDRAADLCGSKAGEFQNFVSVTISKLSSMSCN